MPKKYYVIQQRMTVLNPHHIAGKNDKWIDIPTQPGNRFDKEEADKIAEVFNKEYEEHEQYKGYFEFRVDERE